MVGNNIFSNQSNKEEEIYVTKIIQLTSFNVKSMMWGCQLTSLSKKYFVRRIPHNSKKYFVVRIEEKESKISKGQEEIRRKVGWMTG